MKRIKLWWRRRQLRKRIKQLENAGPRCCTCDRGFDVGCNKWLDDKIKQLYFELMETY